MAILEENTIWIKSARLGFPALVEPKASAPGAALKYGCVFILDPAAEELKELKQVILEMATAKWGDGAADILNMIKNDKKLRCYGDGGEKINSKSGKVYDGFDGMKFIGATNDNKPKLYGADAKELAPTANANQLFVGGNNVAGIFSLWLQDNKFGRGVRSNLVGVQYLSDGEHFGRPETEVEGIFQAAPKVENTAGSGDEESFI